ncbi:5-methylcytosine-specific restriction enzyme subunit McrC [Paenarthrobacter nicotinovorans]|uniref:McrC family protein n=1 Tax=Micrococcaceae TaxID=1268 RepID=UPI000876D8AB|nr:MULTISPECIES: restriction endonuclease [Micrococcaceae]MDR6437049.1 5-methylcytosine-specific restriction enzyme subunit McrC [Paenarthrobacter nicotinovorans]SCZ54723.1 5-methylcytosine-specific restriction enzyme subunit McrC [Arthrobacter sp. UNCCL28]
MPTQIILDELQGYPEPVVLEREVAATLRDTGLVTVVPAHNGAWTILPSGKVGAVQIDDLLVRVNPKEKVGLSRLLFLLGYAADPGFRPGNVAAEEDKDLFAALGESLARHGERALERGPLNGYVHMEESLRTVRGRIRVGDQMTRRPGMLLPLEVSYDDYTSDVAENQILRAAIRMMLHVPRLTESLVARLAHLNSKLDGVSALNHGAPLPSWSESRINGHYVPALRLAEIILRTMSAEAGMGHRAVASFVVNMATVFEDFVATALREALEPYPGLTESQYEAFLDEAEPGYPSSDRVRMYVDVVHSVGGRPAMIFDAKYKAASAGGAYPNADHYQMLAYCTALGVPRAWLVYAGAGEPRVRRVLNTGVSVVEFPLDLSQEPEALLVRVRELAGHAYRSEFTLDAAGGA